MEIGVWESSKSSGRFICNCLAAYKSFSLWAWNKSNLEITFHIKTSHACVSAPVLWKICSEQNLAELNSSQVLPPGLSDAPSADGDRPGCQVLNENWALEATHQNTEKNMWPMCISQTFQLIVI